METKVNTVIETDQSISSQPLCISLTHNEIKDIAFVLYQKTVRLKSDCLSQQHTIESLEEKIDGAYDVKDILEIARELYQDKLAELDNYTKLLAKFKN